MIHFLLAVALLIYIGKQVIPAWRNWRSRRWARSRCSNLRDVLAEQPPEPAGVSSARRIRTALVVGWAVLIVGGVILLAGGVR